MVSTTNRTTKTLLLAVMLGYALAMDLPGDSDGDSDCDSDGDLPKQLSDFARKQMERQELYRYWDRINQVVPHQYRYERAYSKAPRQLAFAALEQKCRLPAGVIHQIADFLQWVPGLRCLRCVYVEELTGQDTTRGEARVVYFNTTDSVYEFESAILNAFRKGPNYDVTLTTTPDRPGSSVDLIWAAHMGGSTTRLVPYMGDGDTIRARFQTKVLP